MLLSATQQVKTTFTSVCVPCVVKGWKINMSQNLLFKIKKFIAAA